MLEGFTEVGDLGMGLMPLLVSRVFSFVEHHAICGAQRASQFFGAWDDCEGLASFGRTHSRIGGQVSGEFQWLSLFELEILFLKCSIVVQLY